MTADSTHLPAAAFDAASPILVFGGPYSNLRATETMIARADALGLPPSQVICTGDIVAYAAEPEETACRIAGWGCHVVAGNCEQSLADGAADCGCNFEEGTACDLIAKGWYPFASARISQETRAWMRALPVSLSFEFAALKFRVVHGGVRETARWVFASRANVIDEEIGDASADVVIAGHCGLPFIARSPHGVWFNPGVIGMPANDGTADAWYGLVTPLDGGGVKLSTHRFAYDHGAAAATMRRYGHANEYARTLLTGIWPSFDVLPETERAATGKRIAPRTLTVRPRSAQPPRAAARKSAIA